MQQMLHTVLDGGRVISTMEQPIDTACQAIPEQRGQRDGALSSAHTNLGHVLVLAMGGPGNRHRPAAKQSGSRSEDIEAAKPLRVLVVEDEAIIAMEIEMTLEDLGAEVVGVAATAEDAVRLAIVHRPDCVTMDINLKGDRDGISAALEIHKALGIRAIFVSAYGSDETRGRAQPSRPFGWVQKPIRSKDLAEALGRVRQEL